MAHRPTALDLAAAAAGAQPPALPEHKRFRTLLGKIDQARQRLQTWQEQLPLFAPMHQARVAPVLAELQAARRAWALELDVLVQQKRWSKTDRQTLSQMICDLCSSLIDAADAPDDVLKALYNRHAEVDFDTEDRQHLEAMKSLLEDMAGVDLGDGPVDSVDELMARAQAHMRQLHAERWAAGQGAAGNAPPEADEAAASRPGAQGRRPTKARPKTAAQQRADETAARISQTVREVYRKLASALHPDRAGAATTPEQRQLLSDRMAAANSAYAAGDLLALLSLQLQIEQVDIAHAASVAAAEVKHFNKVLAEQLREIEAEIDDRQDAFCATYGLLTERRLDPARLGALLDEELRDLGRVRLALERERRHLVGDVAAAKRFLKQVRAEQRALGGLEDDLFF